MSEDLDIEATVIGQVSDPPVGVTRLGDSVQIHVGPITVMLNAAGATLLGQALLRLSPPTDPAPDGDAAAQM